jgi:hypothetical protein
MLALDPLFLPAARPNGAICASTVRQTSWRKQHKWSVIRHHGGAMDRGFPRLAAGPQAYDHEPLSGAGSPGLAAPCVGLQNG